MTKHDFVKALAKESGVTQDQCLKVLGAIESVVKTSVVEGGEQIQITGFGTFKQKVAKSRDAKNPMTGETIKTKAFRSVSFSASQSLKQFD